MPLDEMLWEDIRRDTMPPQIRQALALYGKRCTYVSLSPWQGDPPAVPVRVQRNLECFNTAAEIVALPYVRRELPMLGEDLEAGAPSSGWTLIELRTDDGGSVWAWSLMVPWDYDPLVAFHQYFWVDPMQRSRNPDRDGLALLSVFFTHLHELVKEGYLAVISTVDNPILRAVATSRFPVLDALEIRISMEGK